MIVLHLGKCPECGGEWDGQGEVCYKCVRNFFSQKEVATLYTRKFRRFLIPYDEREAHWQSWLQGLRDAGLVTKTDSIKWRVPVW